MCPTCQEQPLKEILELQSPGWNGIQPPGQAAPLRLGCSGLWLEHPRGQSLQNLSVLVFGCSPDVHLGIPPSSWRPVPPTFVPLLQGQPGPISASSAQNHC